MDWDKTINELLDKYFDGKTSLKEEEQIRNYFKQDKIAAKLEEYRPFFSYLTENKKEQYIRPLPTKPKINSIYRWVSVAAIMVFLITIAGVNFYKDYQQQKEAELAYNQFKNALELVSDNLQKGTSKVVYLNEFEKAKTKIFINQ